MASINIIYISLISYIYFGINEFFSSMEQSLLLVLTVMSHAFLQP